MPGGLAARSSPEHPPGWGSWGVLRFLRNFGEGCGVPWGAVPCRAVPCGAAPCRRGSAPPAAVCRKWEGGDPGVANQKTPTSLLLTPEGGFHSFGYTARDYYHDLDPEEARDWLYFEKFKMKIHSTSVRLQERGARPAEPLLRRGGGHRFRHHVQRLRLQLLQRPRGHPHDEVTRSRGPHAAPAGLVSPESPEQLLIALEPEAASIYCRKLRLHQLVELSCRAPPNGLGPHRDIDSSFRQAGGEPKGGHHGDTGVPWDEVGVLWGDRYIVADCGGGTVDLTVHQIEKPQGTLKELYKASGGPYGAVGVDLAFERLLCHIFGDDFIATFKAKRPAAWVDLTIAFEARKRAAAPSRASPLNVSLPFSFIDFYRKHRGQNVETRFSPTHRHRGGSLTPCLTPNPLFLSPDALLKKPEVQGIKFLFLVGGFAESPMLQHAVQAAFGAACRVVIPQDVGLTILKGAVLFGLDPTIVRVRRSPLTYGVGVLNKFVEGKHPREKLLVKEGKNWCTDIFEKFVSVDQSVALGEVVQRSYCPARPGQRKTIINIYCSAADDVVYITDPGVRKCGTVSLELPQLEGGDGDTGSPRARREIRAAMQFGDTEIKVTAVDMSTSKTVRATIDFLSN
uniref:Heat shock 70 kDa protein 12B n=1 Tax=Anas zonorhyncha TaxID=75864 RepID=A0A8B9ZZV3_9AVES